MTEKTLAIDAEALLEAFQRDEVRIVHGEADGGEVGLATDAQLNERIAELTAQLASARSDIESATLNWRNTARTAWERNGKLEKQLKEAEREREIERAWADQFYGLAQKLQQTLDAVLEKKSAAEADAGRLRKIADAAIATSIASNAITRLQDATPVGNRLPAFYDSINTLMYAERAARSARILAVREYRAALRAEPSEGEK